MDDTTLTHLFARMDERTAQQTDVMLQISQNMVRLSEVQERTMHVMDTHLTRLAEMLAAMHARAAWQDVILVRIEGHLERQDAILARMDEHTVMIAQILARFDQGRNGR